MNKEALSKAVLAGIFAASASISYGSSDAHEGAMASSGGEKEKCYGIAKKAKNDCHTDAHACGGLAKTDYDPKEWKFVKKGKCKKIQEKIKKKMAKKAAKAEKKAAQKKGQGVAK